MQFFNCRPQLVSAAEEGGNLNDISVLGDRRHLEGIGDLELRGSVLDVFFEEFVEHLSRAIREGIEERLAVGAGRFRSFAPRTERRTIGYMAEQVEGVGIRLLRGLGQFLEGDTPLLQGLDDPIVPPSQSEAIAADLAAHGIRHAYITFAGESHGFRKAESVITSLEAELAFYGEIFGFTPPGVPPLELS